MPLLEGRVPVEVFGAQCLVEQVTLDGCETECLAVLLEQLLVGRFGAFLEHVPEHFVQIGPHAVQACAWFVIDIAIAIGVVVVVVVNRLPLDVADAYR